MIQISHLYQLQKTDSELDRVKLRLSKVLAELANDQRTRATRLVLESAENKLKAEQITFQELDDQINQRKSKRELSSSSMYSGKVTSPKELKSLEDEVAVLTRQINELEDQLLESMEKVESLSALRDTAKSDLSQVEAHIIEANAQLAGEKRLLDTAISRLESERQAVLTQIPDDLVGLYQELRSTKNGVAVALVEEEACAVCGAQLAPAEWQAVRTMIRIVNCRACGRILYAG